MDNTQTYIKMSEKAEEIQAIYLKVAGFPPHNAGYLRDSEGHNLYRCKLGDSPIWLPRQDQLQEMVPTGENLEAFEVGHGNQIRYQLEGFCHNSKLDYTNQFTSMEQLWLAFVMKEKYNKVWDGKEWTKYS